MEYDLTDDDDLHRACDSVRLDPAWLNGVTDFIEEVSHALEDYDLFLNENFQERLWNNNPICEAQQAPGVNVDQVIQDKDFLNWFYDHCNEIWDLEPQDRTEPLCNFTDELLNKMVGYSTRSNDDRPIFCIYRALAALFPANFTCLASTEYLSNIAKQMGINVHKHNTSQVVEGHRRILDQFARVLGDPGDLDEVIQRMILPWGLLDVVPQEASILNTIFYGPPGTGKTYATTRHCVKICDGTVPSDWSNKKIRDRYSELVTERRIEFVTFHQSYGYEEFVEGLRPDTGNGAGFSLSPTEGVLRRIAEHARNKTEPYVLVIDEINRANVLRAMNDRLEFLIDRDHLIGHAWLMKAQTKAEVDRVMRRKIIPLIAEYFHDDWEKVRAVLGGTDDFVNREKLNPPPGLDDMGEDRYRWTVKEYFDDDAYDRLISDQA